MLGVRGVLGDLYLSPKTRRGVDSGLWVLGTVTMARGIAVLIMLAIRG